MKNPILAKISNPVIPHLGDGPIEQGGTNIGKFISSLTGAMLIFAFVLAFFYLLIGGVQWITSGGDKANLESARNKIIHAIIGIGIVAAVWAVILLVGKFLDLDFENLPLPTLGGV